MDIEEQEWLESLREIPIAFAARAEEVGQQQAAEESWEKAKKDLHAWFDECDQHRREHGIPEDEL